MYIKDLKKLHPKTIVGDQFAVTIKERVNDYGPPGKLGDRINPLIIIWSEDDENWSEVNTFDVGHLPGLVRALLEASKDVIVEWPEHGHLSL